MMITPRYTFLAALLALSTSCAQGLAYSRELAGLEVVERKLQNSSDEFSTTALNSTLSSNVTADTNSSAGVEEHHDDEHLDEGEEHDQDHEEDGHVTKPWGPALLAALLVNSASFIGIFIVFITAVTAGRKGSHTRDFHGLLHICLPSFAAGALLATSVFLIIPEAIQLLEGGHDAEDEHGAHRSLEEEESGPSESEVAWKFGAAVLGGYLLPSFIGSFFAHGHVLPAEALEDPPAVVTATEELDVDDEENKPEHHPGNVIDDQQKTKKQINYRLASSLLIGDFFHNFADGIFIGNAFMLCDRSIAMTVAASTIFHELAQELADFTLLVHQCGFSPLWALLLNFVSGLSVMLGVIVILAADVSPVATGSILAVSAGVYVFISAAECQPRVEKELHCFKDRMIAMFCFILGCIPIGLVLLKHKHCE
jgi:zinc transporter ZupT